MPSGRTRQFDVDETLDRALEVFWTRGYEGTTLLNNFGGVAHPQLADERGGAMTTPLHRGLTTAHPPVD